MSARAAALTALLSTLLTLPLYAQAQYDPKSRWDPSMDPMSRMGWDAQTVSLTGVVRGLDGHPVPNARMDLHDTGNGTIRQTQYTGPTGAFAFRDVPAGSYELIASYGINEARERVDLLAGSYSLVIRVAVGGSDSHQQTVSVAQMGVPGKARDQVNKAKESLYKGKLDAAREHVNKALQIYPRFAEAHMTLGIVDLQEQRLQEAAGEIENSIQLDPNIPMAYVALGATYNAQGRFDDALRTLNNGSRLAPSSWQSSFEMAKADLGKGDFSAALSHINRVQQLSKTDYLPLHLVKAHALLGMKAYHQAIDELQTYLSGNPQDGTAAEARQTLEDARAFASANSK